MEHYLVFPRRSFGAGISAKITKFVKRADLKYLVGVSRDVARRIPKGWEKGGGKKPRISLYTSSEFRKLRMFVHSIWLDC